MTGAIFAACSRPQKLENDQRAAGTHPGSPGASPRIGVSVRDRGDGTRPILRLAFCFPDAPQFDPKIVRIRLDRLDPPRSTCDVSALGNASLWGEWTFGTSTPGFRSVGCVAISDGTYEAYVYGPIGRGTVRFSVKKGRIERLPWDEWDRVGDNGACVANKRDVPRFLENGVSFPKQLRTGVASANARDLREDLIGDAE